MPYMYVFKINIDLKAVSEVGILHVSFLSLVWMNVAISM